MKAEKRTFTTYSLAISSNIDADHVIHMTKSIQYRINKCKNKPIAVPCKRQYCTYFHMNSVNNKSKLKIDQIVSWQEG